MRYRSRPIEQARTPAGSLRAGGWAHRLAVLAFAFVWLSGNCLQGYQGTSSAPVNIQVVDAQGGVIPDAAVLLMKEDQVFTRTKTGADGHALVRLGSGQYSVTIHRAGYTPVEQVVDIRSMPGPVLDVKVTLFPQTQETVTVEANQEEITNQSSSPEESIKPQEANESPLRPLTLTGALPLIPGVVLAPNCQTQIQGAGEMHSALTVDSVDSGDPATGRFGLSAPIDVVDSVHVLVSPYLAQYGRFTSGVVTAETRPGGNEWHYDLNDPLPEFRIRSGHVRGLKSATPRLSFGGPIIADRVSISEGLEFVDNKVLIRTLSFPFNETKRCHSIRSQGQMWLWRLGSHHLRCRGLRFRVSTARCDCRCRPLLADPCDRQTRAAECAYLQPVARSSRPASSAASVGKSQARAGNRAA